MKTARIIGVVGGSGGVGASVLTAAIAVRAAQACLRPVCLDGDRLGGGLDVTLGVEQERGVRWPDLAGARGRIDGSELLARLPSVDGVWVLSFDRARDVPLVAEIVREVLLALSAAADVIVVDLPRPDHEIFAALAPSVSRRVALSAYQRQGQSFRGHGGGSPGPASPGSGPRGAVAGRRRAPWHTARKLRQGRPGGGGRHGAGAVCHRVAT